MNKENSKNILDLTHTEAREFFLDEERYFTLDLPKYFTFTKILNDLSAELDRKKLSKYFSDTKLKDVEHANYKLFNNKNGEYSWRVFQLIHPALYVSLVNEITTKTNWKSILNRFEEFKISKNIDCSSIPVVKSDEQRIEKGEQILTWWEEVEQKSIALSLEYGYIFHTDIVDCYGSIYTHSIPWALHTKKKAKKNRNQNSPIGNFIDTTLRQMSYGQTNGIPQGSILMDFIAEMILGYADLELSNKISELNELNEDYKIEDYKIIRYRDDYRIFVNNPETGKKVIKELTNILATIGMRISSEKTHFSDDVIVSSIKKDKLFWLMNKPNEYSFTNFEKTYFSDNAIGSSIKKDKENSLMNETNESSTTNSEGFCSIEEVFVSTIEKEKLCSRMNKTYDRGITKSLLIIKNLSEQFPNSGTLARELQGFYKKIHGLNYVGNIEVSISIITDIAYKNPRAYPISVSIIGKFISLVDDVEEKKSFIEKVEKKIKRLPNTELLSLWLQRLTLKFDPKKPYQGKLSEKVINENIEVWDSSWLNNNMQNIINQTVVDKQYIESMDEYPNKEEISLFNNDYQYK